MARIFFQSRNTAEDLRRRLGWRDVESTSSGQAAGDFDPPMDVVETDTAIEIVVDVPGVDLDGLSIVFRQGILLVTGLKRPARCQHREAAFHLAERGFGRFARAVQLSGAYNARRATATLIAGELRIVLPRVDDRRGAEIRLQVRRPEADAADGVQ